MSLIVNSLWFEMKIAGYPVVVEGHSANQAHYLRGRLPAREKQPLLVKDIIGAFIPDVLESDEGWMKNILSFLNDIYILDGSIGYQKDHTGTASLFGAFQFKNGDDNLWMFFCKSYGAKESFAFSLNQEIPEMEALIAKDLEYNGQIEVPEDPAGHEIIPPKWWDFDLEETEPLSVSLQLSDLSNALPTDLPNLTISISQFLYSDSEKSIFGQVTMGNLQPFGTGGPSFSVKKFGALQTTETPYAFMGIFSASIGAGNSKKEIEIEVNYSPEGWSFDVNIDSGFTLKDFLSFLGIGGWLPADLSAFEQIAIHNTRMNCRSVDGVISAEIKCDMLANAPISLFGDFISLGESLSIDISYSSDQFEGSIAGIWLLGSTRFQTSIEFPELKVAAQMKAGDILDVSSLGTRVLAGLDIPGDVSFQQMEFNGNVTQKTFDILISGGSNWGFSLAGKRYAFQTLNLTVDYANQAVSQASIDGTFTLAGTQMEAAATYLDADGWEFSGNTVTGEEVNLSSLAEEALQAFEIPASLPELSLTDINFESKPAQGEYSLTFRSASPWSIIEGFSLDIQSFDARVWRELGVSQSSFKISTILSIGSTSIPLLGEYQGGAMGFSVDKEAVTPPIVVQPQELIQTFAGGDDLPDILDQAITIYELSINTKTKEFHFDCRTTINFSGTPTQIELTIAMVKNAAGYSKQFTGKINISDKEFALDLVADPQKTRLLAAFSTENPNGASLNLATFIQEISGGDSISIDDSFTNLQLYHLQLNYEKINSPEKKTYGLQGSFGWNPVIDIIGELRVRSTFSFSKEISHAASPSTQITTTTTGTVSGLVEVPIPGLEFLSLGAKYVFTKTAINSSASPTTTKELTLQLWTKAFLFEGEISSHAGNMELTFSADYLRGNGKPSLGDIFTFFASLVDPSIDDFEFDYPWNFITDKEIDISAIGLRLKEENNDKIFGISIESDILESIVPSELASIITVSELRLSYSKNTKRASVTMAGSIVGNTFSTNFDPINGAPPEVPGKSGALFDLRYLGLGQRVAFTQAANVSSIKEVMDLLRGVIDAGELKLKENRALGNGNPMALFGDNGPIAFSPESEWLVGMDVTLLKMLNLSIIFNDPVIYGLRIELYGKYAKNFAGLEFEILYQKISPTIGKYHIELVLPDYVRHLQFGAVSVTLPCLVLDIFTNGDFKVDLGFPWEFNYERSFALEVFPFTGAGGFYFNKLSAATATSTPAIPESRGVFTPVYEFGLGLKIGLGKSFNKGPLKAEVSITVQGIIEGVISWYNPADGSEKILYYKIRGGVAIVGRLYGEVDFEVISVSVEVIAEAKVIFLLESYEPIQLELSARVSVKAKAKVLFVTVKFSFSLSVTESFTIDSPDGGTAPWLIG